ncbi:hypothetical protein SCP_0405610 [Sparassis crispa]|uniref:Uncharacterized protein n=1 Tax=Sparassis crispa TaxID=139825 RepID=A0A401GJ84_9APHY|nr:hypothetical protein SCP_0405610 [Sparassis crispa]GBE82181.1 hypothetical protein SCP_0405610 [Sparassis crispa]
MRLGPYLQIEDFNVRAASPVSSITSSSGDVRGSDIPCLRGRPAFENQDPGVSLP